MRTTKGVAIERKRASASSIAQTIGSQVSKLSRNTKLATIETMKEIKNDSAPPENTECNSVPLLKKQFAKQRRRRREYSVVCQDTSRMKPAGTASALQFVENVAIHRHNPPTATLAAANLLNQTIL
jgi:hypothetical protein